jgi:hypothetical protein
MATVAAHSPELRLDAPRPLSSAGATLGAIDVRAAANAVTESVKSSGSAAFAIHWQTSPEFVRVARNFRRNGLPIVRLWELDYAASGPAGTAASQAVCQGRVSS